MSSLWPTSPRTRHSWSKLRDDNNKIHPVTTHVEMTDLNDSASAGLAISRNNTLNGIESTEGDEIRHTGTADPILPVDSSQPHHHQHEFKVYKRRWFGLVQLMLMNIMVSWDWLTYAPLANTSAEFFSTSSSVISWLSTAFLFAFVFAAPVSYHFLHTYGPKGSIVTSAVLVLLGNWIRYGSTRSSPPSFAGVMVGQILIGLAQPFVLAAPTQFSDMWFTSRGRVGATALASLSNPFGGALGQLIGPLIATKPSDVPNLTLIVAIISSVVCVPSFFIPAKPPTPVSAHSSGQKPPFVKQLRTLVANPTSWIILIVFGVYAGLFNSFSSLITPILTPYGFTEDESGLAGAVLILSGLVVAAVTSPLTDKYKKYLLLIKSLVPLLGICYLVLIWAPPTRGLPAPFIICAFLGACSFSLVPIVLEWAAEITYPVGPELTSVIFWSSGQLFGGVFIVVSDALMASPTADPPFNMQRALIFQAVLALVVVPPVMALGYVGSVEARRLEVDAHTEGELQGAGE